MSIAFFDLDKTLIADNSARLYMWHLYQENDISLWQLLNASYWLGKYHLGFTNIEKVIHKSISLLSGEKAKNISQKTIAFYHDSIKNLYRPKALLAINDHKHFGKIETSINTF